MANQFTMRVWRGDASGGEFKEYKVESQEGMVVLDGLACVVACGGGKNNCHAGGKLHHVH